MSALRVFLICGLALFFFSQLVLSRPDGAAEEGGLKSVEAKVSVAVEELRKAMGDLVQNITSAIHKEIEKNPQASALYKNVTESLASAAKEIREATGTAA